LLGTLYLEGLDMSLLLTEITCFDGLSNSCIVFAADRRISLNGKYDSTRKKIFQIPSLHAGIGYFGLAEVHTKGNSLPNVFANELACNLNKVISPGIRKKYISGFHLAGYNSNGIPEFWFIRNVQDDSKTITGQYEAREDFLSTNARALGYDGENPRSIKNLVAQIYRNGDFRAHVTAWGKIDEGFGSLFKEPGFKKLVSISDYEQWVKFKMEVIAYFYKKYSKVSLIARPIDTFTIKGTDA
jgi:hypothetical protein